MSVWRNAATPGSTSTTMPSDSGSSMAASPASSATSSRSKRGPATLATSRTLRAAGDSGWARATTASRMLSGSGISSSPETSTPLPVWTTRPAAASAAQSSSTKNGIPWVRSWRVRASDGAGAVPSVRAASSAVSAGPRQPTTISSSRPARRRPARIRRSGWPRLISSLRYAPRISSGSSADRAAERGQELEGRRVGPMEVVQEHDRRSAPHDRLQRGVDGLGHRRPVAVRRWSPELGQEGRQVRLQGAALVEPVRIDAGAGRAARRRPGRTGRVPAPARSRAGGAAPRRAAPPPRGASCRRRPRPRAERSRHARRAGEPAPPRARPVPARGPRVRAVRWLPTSSAFAGHPLGTGDAMPTS